MGDHIIIPTDDPANPLQLPRSFVFSDQFISRLDQVFSYARRIKYPGIEGNLAAMLNLNTDADRIALVEFYRRIRQFIEEGRDHVWRWYIANLMQPVRLSQNPVSRLVGNPPWVVYNAMTNERQNAFRRQAEDRKIWAGANLATQNDLAATFVATCVDYYLQPNGKFGFILPYAALRAGQWKKFRTGQWSLYEDSGRKPTLADLSNGAWDFFDVNAKPFPQANSSAVFGTRLDTANRRRRPVPLSAILTVSNSGTVAPRMSWDTVRPMLVYTKRRDRTTAPSDAYSGAFRNGATLFPQPLVVFEEAKSRALGKVYFRTNSGKYAWKGQGRDGRIEERFVKPALFSRLLLPYGMTGQSNIIAPFAPDGSRLETDSLEGNDATDFRLYWDIADYDWRRLSGPRPPDTLLDQVDYQGKLSSQLGNTERGKVTYQRSGSWLISNVVPSQLIVDGTLNWYASSNENELYYLAAIFNARRLAEFYKEHCRASDRHFQMGPVENLPIPKFDANNEHHANLSAQSALAHRRVATLVAERQAAKRKTTRGDVLKDPAMQPILASIDDSARAILPDYCS